MPAAIARVPCGRRLSQPTASCSTQACRRTHMPRRTLFCLFACFAASCVPLVGAPTPVARVCTLFQLGVLVADIASHFDITPRRVNQILREGGLRAALPPKPSHAVLDRIIAAETARFGPNYGFAMLHGALTKLYPQWRFTRREYTPASGGSRRARCAHAVTLRSTVCDVGTTMLRTLATRATWTWRANCRSTGCMLVRVQMTHTSLSPVLCTSTVCERRRNRRRLYSDVHRVAHVDQQVATDDLSAGGLSPLPTC